MSRCLFIRSFTLLLGVLAGSPAVAWADSPEIRSGRLVCVEFFVPQSSGIPDLENPRYERLLGAVALGEVVAHACVVPTRPGVPTPVRLATVRPRMTQGISPYLVTREYVRFDPVGGVSLRNMVLREPADSLSPLGPDRPGPVLQVTLNEGPSADELSVVMRVESTGGGPPIELERLFELGSPRPVHYLTIAPPAGVVGPKHRVVFLRWERIP